MLTDWLLDWVAPRRCPGCNAPGSEAWCARCGVPEPSAGAGLLLGVPVYAAGAYTGALGEAIRRFKYEPRPELARPLARLLVTRARQLELHRSTAWVPVPLHYARLVERGFNQSALIARELSRATRTPFHARLLVRVRDTGQQATLERAERAANVLAAFAVRGRAPTDAVLVDDVVTTGATVSACITALREKGVKVRAVFTLARTHPL